MFLQAPENFFGIVCGNVFTSKSIQLFRDVSQYFFVFSTYIPVYNVIFYAICIMKLFFVQKKSSKKLLFLKKVLKNN